MGPNMERLAQRLVFRLKKKYYSSPNVRVPVPGELLFDLLLEEEEEEEGEEEVDGIKIAQQQRVNFAPSYLRQFRDMTKQRIVLIGGVGEGGGGKRVDIMDVVLYKKMFEKKKEEEEETTLANTIHTTVAWINKC